MDIQRYQEGKPKSKNYKENVPKERWATNQTHKRKQVSKRVYSVTTLAYPKKYQMYTWNKLNRAIFHQTQKAMVVRNSVLVPVTKKWFVRSNGDTTIVFITTRVPGVAVHQAQRGMIVWNNALAPVSETWFVRNIRESTRVIIMTKIPILVWVDMMNQ